jgi:hypothetical protein
VKRLATLIAKGITSVVFCGVTTFLGIFIAALFFSRYSQAEEYLGGGIGLLFGLATTIDYFVRL